MARQQRITKLTPRHSRFLALVAEGASVSQASKQLGMHVATGSTVLHSDVGKAELARLTANLEGQLAERLPVLLKKALDDAERTLDRGLDPRCRLQAGSLVCALAFALIQLPLPELPSPRQGRHEDPTSIGS